MCGILFAIGGDSPLPPSSFHTSLQTLLPRGPDSSHSFTINSMSVGFNRLTINGLEIDSMQPMMQQNCILICNGEIFNYKKLIRQHELENVYRSTSDCEIIIHLYRKYGIRKTIDSLYGDFAFILHDLQTSTTYIARDIVGKRPLFYGLHVDRWMFASELKAFPSQYTHVVQFPPRHFAILRPESSTSIELVSYYTFQPCYSTDIHLEKWHIANIRALLNRAVTSQLMSDVPFGCLLSGGIDSTIIAGLVANSFPPNTINTYSIGMKGSVDVAFSIIAATHFQTNHHVVEYTSDEFIHAIRDTIYCIESYDVTTVRASIGNHLISKWIAANTKDKVLFCGDLSDEIFGSYKGFMYAPNDDEFEHMNKQLIQDVHYFDGLRCDRSISGAGLEPRIPFGDTDLVSYVMNEMSPYYKRWGYDRMEKYILRKAFEYLVPPDLCWRRKTAFSDGIGNTDTPFYTLIQTHMETQYTDEEYNEKRRKYTHNCPYDKESLYYRELFEELFPNQSHVIPYFWKQPFMKQQDPSAWFTEKNT